MLAPAIRPRTVASAKGFRVCDVRDGDGAINLRGYGMSCTKRLCKVLASALFVVAALAADAGAPRAQDDKTAEEVFRNHISGQIIQTKCINCHVAGGLSGEYPAGVRAVIGYVRPRGAQPADTPESSRRSGGRGRRDLHPEQDPGGVARRRRAGAGGDPRVREHGALPGAAGRRVRADTDAEEAVRHSDNGIAPARRCAGRR